MSVMEYISGQFSYPEGIGGAVVCKISNITNSIQYRAVKKFVCKDLNAKVLDIGFGNGYMIKKLSDQYNIKIYGIDISYDMLRKATQKNADNVALNKVILQQGYASQLPYNDNFFDSVYTINTIYFWEDFEKTFTEILRVLKDGGNLIATFYSKEFLDSAPYCKSEFSKFTPNKIREMAREYGFKNVKIKILNDEKAYCLLCEKDNG